MNQTGWKKRNHTLVWWVQKKWSERKMTNGEHLSFKVAFCYSRCALEPFPPKKTKMKWIWNSRCFITRTDPEASHYISFSLNLPPPTSTSAVIRTFIQILSLENKWVFIFCMFMFQTSSFKGITAFSFKLWGKKMFFIGKYIKKCKWCSIFRLKIFMISLLTFSSVVEKE